MTPKPLLMDKDDDVIDSAKVMIRHRISGLPVIDNNTLNLQGIITKNRYCKNNFKNTRMITLDLL